MLVIHNVDTCRKVALSCAQSSFPYSRNTDPIPTRYIDLDLVPCVCICRACIELAVSLDSTCMSYISQTHKCLWPASDLLYRAKIDHRQQVQICTFGDKAELHNHGSLQE